MTPDDHLRSEWTRLRESTQAPDLGDLRRRSEARVARRNSTIAAGGAAALAIGALGVTLGGGLGMGSSAEPESASVASGSVGSQTEAQSPTTPSQAREQAREQTQEYDMPFGQDAPRPGMTSPEGDSIIDRLRRNEDQLTVPFPHSMPQSRALAEGPAVDAFAALADRILVFGADDAVLTDSGTAPSLHVRAAREVLKSPSSAPAGAGVSLTLTGSQSPTGSGTGLYLVFAKQGRVLALYSINGNYASQVAPVKVSAPGMMRIDELRSALRD